MECSNMAAEFKKGEKPGSGTNVEIEIRTSCTPGYLQRLKARLARTAKVMQY